MKIEIFLEKIYELLPELREEYYISGEFIGYVRGIDYVQINGLVLFYQFFNPQNEPCNWQLDRARGFGLRSSGTTTKEGSVTPLVVFQNDSLGLHHPKSVSGCRAEMLLSLLSEACIRYRKTNLQVQNLELTEKILKIFSLGE